MLKKALKIVLIAIGGIVGIIILLVAGLSIFGKGHLSFNLPVEHKPAYTVPDGADFPAALHVEGNRLVDPQGETVRLKGVMVPDLDHLRAEKRFNEALLEEIQNTGANVVRIPVSPEGWQHHADYLWRYLDPLVTWAGSHGMYVIIDLHFIGNIATGKGEQMPDIDMPAAQFSDEFWSQVAPYFKDAPHVLFEIYNEPAEISSAEWVQSSTHLVKLIRSLGTTQPLIVGGVEYSRDLSWVLESPLDDSGLVYASHIYPAHSSSSWGRWFGDVAAKYPVLMTEWGYFDAKTVQGPAYLAGSQQGYGDPFLAYLDERQIGWVACWYDGDWLPPMFNEDGKDLNEYGEWVLGELKSE